MPPRLFRARRRLVTPSQSQRSQFGALEGNSTADSSALPPGYSDPRLRGIDPGTVGGSANSGYNMAARRYAVTRGDPYAQAARREREIGRRMPLPYQAPSALAGMPSVTGVSPEDQNIYQDLHPEGSVHASGSVAGMRQTHSGTFGARTDTSGGPWWSARKRFGYGQLGYRDTGYSEEWDTPERRERRAGRLTAVTRFDQEVDPQRPYLHLRARGQSAQAEGTYAGNALVRVTPGISEAGAIERRRFIIGGGFIAAFDLKGWDNVEIDIQELMTDTFVEFAWTTDGLSGDDRSLYFPETVASAAVVSPVPQGAFELILEDPAPAVPGTVVTITWSTQIGGAVFTFTQVVNDSTVAGGPYFGEPVPVLGTAFSLDTTTDAMWRLRPI